ncbi:MAG: CoA ester lyase, partial [Candidatus Izimaplasma sp.]|nr:CoA ester lyase [Candidatus Izimaplasma bacterium]
MSRSYLFIPGNTPSMIQNLDVFDSDAIIIDFEDSVNAFDKDSARILIKNFLTKYSYNEVDIFIRINSADSIDFYSDVNETNDLDITGYVLPKASVEAIKQLNRITNKSIIPIVESPMALLRVEDISKQKNVVALLFGAEDYTKELGIKRTLEAKEILYARSIIAITANAYNIDAIDTPYTSKDDDKGLYIDTVNARNLGFTSKSSIHPNQVDIINQVFSPSLEEIT